MNKLDSKPRRHWDALAGMDPDAAVIDPNDTRGLKNEYLARIRDCAFATGLDRHGIERGTLLDLGCGTGSATQPLLRAGHRVVGIDISRDLLHHARKRCGDDDCLFVQSDGLTLPVADAVFDAAVIYGVLIYLVDDRQTRDVLARLRVALKPGAPLIMIEQARRRRRCVEDGLKCQRSIVEWRQLLEAAGFAVRSSRILRHGRFPATPLIRAGLLPRSLWSWAHRLETRVAEASGVLPWDYADVAFEATA